MQALARFAAVLLGSLGFVEVGILGALTGIVAGLGIGSGVAMLFAAKGADLSAFHRLRDRQRLGGFMSATLCGAGAAYGGWTTGWAWALAGYALGAITALTVVRQRQQMSNLLQWLFDRRSADSDIRCPSCATIQRSEPSRTGQTETNGVCVGSYPAATSWSRVPSVTPNARTTRSPLALKCCLRSIPEKHATL